MAGSTDSALNKIDFLDPALDLDAAYEQALKEVPGLEEYGKTAFLDFVDEYRKAIPAIDEYKEHMQGVFDDLKQSNPALFENVELQIADIKSPKRALEKIVGDYEGDASKIGDLVRGRIVADTPEQIQTIREYIAEHSDEIGIKEMKDRFAKPSETGFRDINAKIGLTNGVSAEFRVEHRAVMEAAEHTHKPYERAQQIERQIKLEGRSMTAEEEIERKKIRDDVRDIHGEPARAAGLDALLNEEGRAKMALHEAERLKEPLESRLEGRVEDYSPGGKNSKAQKILVSGDQIVDAAEDIATGVRGVSRMAKAGRLAANITGVGAAFGVTSFILTKSAHTDQRDFAEDLKNQGHLTEEAYQAYVELNDNIENLLYGDLAISTADPTGLSITLTVAAEAKARSDFKTWADSYAPNLSDEHFQTLSMSIFPDNSARANMLWEARDNLPSNNAGQPEYLHKAISLNSLYKSACEMHFSPKDSSIYGGNLSQVLADAKNMGIDVENIKNYPAETIQNLRDAIKHEILKELDTHLSNPENIDFMLDQIPVDERLDYVRRLVASENNHDQLVEKHPEIAAYAVAYEKSWFGLSFFIDEDDILKEKPELLNAYIKERTFPASNKTSTVATATQETEATVETGRNYFRPAQDYRPGQDFSDLMSRNGSIYTLPEVGTFSPSIEGTPTTTTLTSAFQKAVGDGRHIEMKAIAGLDRMPLKPLEFNFKPKELSLVFNAKSFVEVEQKQEKTETLEKNDIAANAWRSAPGML